MQNHNSAIGGAWAATRRRGSQHDRGVHTLLCFTMSCSRCQHAVSTQRGEMCPDSNRVNKVTTHTHNNHAYFDSVNVSRQQLFVARLHTYESYIGARDNHGLCIIEEPGRT